MTAAAISPVARKLLVKPGQRVRVLSPEPVIDAALARLPDGASRVTRSVAEVVLLFARDSKALAREAPRAIAALAPEGALWIAYPKISSGVKTDLTRDRGWGPVVSAGFAVVSLVAIDETWSALRWKRDLGGALTAERAARVASRAKEKPAAAKKRARVKPGAPRVSGQPERQ